MCWFSIRLTHYCSIFVVETYRKKWPVEVKTSNKCRNSLVGLHTDTKHRNIYASRRNDNVLIIVTYMIFSVKDKITAKYYSLSTTWRNKDVNHINYFIQLRCVILFQPKTNVFLLMWILKCSFKQSDQN